MLNIKSFSKQVALLLSTGQKASELAHRLGVEALSHFVSEGADGNPTNDARPVDMVYKAMIDGRLHSKSFRLWVETYSPIRWDKDGKVSVLNVKAKTYIPANVEDATANPFWTLIAKADKAPQELNLAGVLAILERMVKKTKEANEQGEIVNDDGKVTAKITDNVVSFRDAVTSLRDEAAKTLAAFKPKSKLIKKAAVA